RELRDQSVILVPVAAAVREDHVRALLVLERLEDFLDPRALVREEPVAEGVEVDGGVRRATQEQLRAAPCLLLPLRRAAEHDPAHGDVVPAREEAQDRAAAADLDVVRVGAEAQDTQPLARRAAERELEHLRPLRTRSAGPARAPAPRA